MPAHHTLRRSLTATAATALVLAAAVPAFAGTPDAAAADRYVGRAGSQVADVSLLGRAIAFGSATVNSDADGVTGTLTGGAIGLGTTLSPSSSTARFGDTAAPGGEACATPALAGALAEAGKLAGSVPQVTVGAVCGRSSAQGRAGDFAARSEGSGAELTVKLPDALRDVVARAAGALSPEVLAAPLRTLLAPTGAPAAAPAALAQAATTLNGVLGAIAPGVTLPEMAPEQTVRTLLERLQGTDLVRLRFGAASATTTGGAATTVSEALNQGGVIDILPEFRAPGGDSLLRISVAASKATVSVERGSTRTTPAITQTVVRLESALLDKVVAGPAVVDGIVHGLPLAAVPGGNLPVVGGILGRGLPLAQVTGALGLHSGPGFVELGPGQSASVLCDGPVAALCSEISVGAARPAATLPTGVTRAEASQMTAHLFKGIGSLAPTELGLGTILASPALAPVLDPAAARSGIALGDVTAIPGMRLVLAGAVAEAGGVHEALPARTALAVPGGPTVAAPNVLVPAALLPRTGPADIPTGAVPLLLGAGIALLVGRRYVRSA